MLKSLIVWIEYIYNHSEDNTLDWNSITERFLVEEDC